MTVPDPSLVAALSDRYRIRDELGSGGMATVYVADDLKHDRTVAVKVMKPELSAATGADRFLREISIAAKLNHPHIVPLHDSGEAAGFLFYVMPLVEGESLRDRLRRETQLALDDALRIGKELAEALAYAHSMGVVHRDIKPENVLLSGGYALVADFGIAKAVSHGGDQLTETGLIAGTVAYMSPEQASGDENVDGRADIYSLACVVYEMLAGEPPYTGPSPYAVIAKRLSEPVPRISVMRETVSLELEATLAKGLARVPADRFATAQQFAEALSPVRVSVSTTFPIPDTREMQAPSRKRTPWMIAAVGAIGIGGMVAGTVFLQNRSPEGPAPEVSADQLAVLPFDFLGNPDVSYLGDQMAYLLSDALDGVGGIRTSNPQAVLGMVAQSGDGRSEANAADVARRLGAGNYLTGVVNEANGTIRVSARLNGDSPGGSVSFSVEGSVADPFALVNGLAVQVLANSGEEADLRSLGSVQTTSVDAFRKYFEGETAVRHGDFLGAAGAFQEAVESDSLFALAYHRLAFSLVATGRSEEARVPMQRALQLSDRLTVRDRRLAEALSAFIRVDAVDADLLYRAIIGEFPDDVEALYGLADVLIHYGPLVGRPMGDVVQAWRAVQRYEPDNPDVLSHLLWAAGLLGETALLDSTATRLIELDPQGFMAPTYRALLAATSGVQSRVDSSVSELLGVDDTRRLIAVAQVGIFVKNLELAGNLAEQLLVEPSRLPEVRAFGETVVAFLESGRGQWRSADQHLRRAESFDSPDGIEARAFLVGLPFLNRQDSDLRIPLQELGTWNAASVGAKGINSPFFDPHRGVHDVLKPYFEATLQIGLGDTAGARRTASDLGAVAEDGDRGQIAATLSHSLAARLAMRRGDAVTAIGELDQGGGLGNLSDRSLSSSVFSQAGERYLRASALDEAGRSDEALVWFESAWMQNIFDLVFLAPSHLERARIYEEEGNAALAVHHYSRFIDLWRDADADLQPVVEVARQRVSALR